MIPIGDNDQPGRGIPIITWGLIIINVLVFLFELTLPAAGLDAFFQTWGAVPSVISNAISHPTAPGSLHGLLTLITSQFLHGGWLHVIGNMVFLAIFGDDIENILGKPLYLLFYLFCGIVAGLVQTFVLANMMGAQDAPGIGASGAIAGVLGAYIVLYPTRRVNVLSPFGRGGLSPTVVPAYVMLGLWFVEQFFAGVTSLSPNAAVSNVGFWAHIGGFVAGFLLILPFRGRASGSGSVQGRAYNP